MAREFIATQTFDSAWINMGLTDEDLRLLQGYIMCMPGAGDLIPGTGGLIKLRWKMQNTGKSGGVRVLYVDFIRQETIILINCYSKGQKR